MLTKLYQSSMRPNENAYFVITNMEYDTLSTDPCMNDLCGGIATGEWGCWVDSSVTRIIQAGVEHGRALDLRESTGMNLEGM